MVVLLKVTIVEEARAITEEAQVIVGEAQVIAGEAQVIVMDQVHVTLATLIAARTGRNVVNFFLLSHINFHSFSNDFFNNLTMNMRLL